MIPAAQGFLAPRWGQAPILLFSPVIMGAIYLFGFILTVVTAVTLQLFCLLLKKVHLIQEQRNYFFPPCPHLILITYVVAYFWIE